MKKKCLSDLVQETLQETNHKLGAEHRAAVCYLWAWAVKAGKVMCSQGMSGEEGLLDFLFCIFRL